MAIWLALLASYRGGFIKRLVGPEATLTDVVGLPEAQLRSRVGLRRTAVDACGDSADGGRGTPSATAGGDRRSDEHGFATVLAAGPQRLSDVLTIPRGVSIVTWEDDAYPTQLRELGDAPPALFLSGRAREGLEALERSPVVAVVGTRGPSPYGIEMARGIARELAAAGVLVISGLASGVDAIAQEAAVATLDAGRTGERRLRKALEVTTVGVLGCGVDVIYPKANAALFHRVVQTGLLISEFPPGTPARAWRFPARNRVIAGLARAVVVVEGGERSGSLLTADFALQLQRDVLAVPGEAGRRLSAGPHKLLRSGAHLCESADDVLEVIGLGLLGWSRRRAPVPGDGAGPLARVIEALDAGERTVDEVAALVGCTAAGAAAILAGLEVEDVIEAADGGRYRLRRDYGCAL